MTETRDKKIFNKIFTKKDIERVWEIFSLNFNESKIKNDASLKMRITCLDETQYETDGDELLKEGDIFDIKKIKTLGLQYSRYNENKRIEFNLKEGNNSEYNNLVVRGDDKNWVAGTFSKIEDLIKSVRPQNIWCIKHKISIIIIVTFIFSNVFLLAINYFHPSYIGNFESSVISIGQYMAGLLYTLFFALLLATTVVDWLIKLWPDIEFDFGPEHEKRQKNKRSRIYIFFTIIGLPLFLLIIERFI